MKHKYFGALPLKGGLFITLTRRFTSDYPYQVRSGFFNSSSFGVVPFFGKDWADIYKLLLGELKL